ncbi:hypothetical protein ACOSQ4_023940 [Xanthoceras sorbifolium]
MLAGSRPKKVRADALRFSVKEGPYGCLQVLGQTRSLRVLGQKSSRSHISPSHLDPRNSDITYILQYTERLPKRHRRGGKDGSNLNK